LKPLFVSNQAIHKHSIKEIFKKDKSRLINICGIEKTQAKDFKFFLEQRNFLKVVDTLEKFEEGMLDPASAQAREFI
jgi:hypothetical protein